MYAPLLIVASFVVFSLHGLLVSGQADVPVITALPADEWKCQAFTGGACDIVHTAGASVAIQTSSSIEDMHAAIEQAISAVAPFVTSSCLTALLRTRCVQDFSPCSEHGGISYRHLPCRDVCHEQYNVCPELMQIMRGAGLPIADCGNDPFYSSDGKTEEPSRFGTFYKDWAYVYPEYYHGHVCYPVEFSEVMLASGEKLLLKCMSWEDATSNKDFVLEEPDCADGTIRTDGICQLKCPHPIYTIGEYQFMYDLHFAIGLIYSVFTLIFIGVSFLASNKIKKKSTGRDQRDVSKDLRRIVLVSCMLYALLGPLLAMVGNDRSTFNFACNGEPVIAPPLVGESYENRMTSGSMSLACEVNRSSIFFVMIAFNCLALNLVYLLLVLRASSIGTNAKFVFQSVGAKVLIVLAIAVPMFLMLLMYSLDGVGSTDDSAEGNMARWTVTCGPRLQPGEEIALVFAPLIFVAVLVSILSARIVLHLKSAASVSGDKKTSANASIIALSKKMIWLGAFCALLAICFIYLSAVTAPKVNEISQTIWFSQMCSWGIDVLVPEMGLDCTSDKSWMAILDKGISGLPGRPTPLALIGTLICQIAIPLTLVVFYSTIEYASLQRKYSGSSNSSMAKTTFFGIRSPSSQSALRSSSVKPITGGTTSTAATSVATTSVARESND